MEQMPRIIQKHQEQLKRQAGRIDRQVGVAKDKKREDRSLLEQARANDRGRDR